MRAALSRLLLAGIVAPAVVQAQSITPTQTTIRLYEQDGGFVLGAEKRVYTNYFNTLRTPYIAVEVSLDYGAAAAGFQLKVGCQMTRPDGRVIDGIWKIGMPIQAGSTHSVDANIMFGAGKEGWQTGISKVTCAASRPLGEVSFQMSPGPSLLTDAEFRATGPPATISRSARSMAALSPWNASRCGKRDQQDLVSPIFMGSPAVTPCLPKVIP